MFNLDYCKSLYSSLQNSLIQNFVACAVVKAPKFSHTTSIIETLRWPKVSECINSRFLSLAYRVYKVLTTTQPSYLYKLISVQSPHNTRSSFYCHHFLDHHHLPVKILIVLFVLHHSQGRQSVSNIVRVQIPFPPLHVEVSPLNPATGSGGAL